MNLVSYIFFNTVETLFRIFPFPCQTGLVKIGNPQRNSPVFLTGNFHLTVLRVKRAIKGLDAFLLVANSRGINVWCAARGGHLDNHSVISALKTSGVEELVERRQVVLPQLAAGGVEAGVIQKKTGWKVIWGPVYAKDIPFFLQRNFRKSPRMRDVTFRWTQRLEMAVVWGFPESLFFSLILIPFWRSAILPVVFFVWLLSSLVFSCFPCYSRWLEHVRRKKSPRFFNFEHGGLQGFLWLGILVGLVAYYLSSEDVSMGFVFRWGLLSLFVILVLSIDLTGCSPVFKSGMHEEKWWDIVLDKEKCRGAGFCEQVCPRSCFEVSKKEHKGALRHSERCVRCGACIVQCPFDALSFIDPKGEKILPETMRRFKLSLLGHRHELKRRL